MVISWMQRVARLSPYADLAYGAPMPGAMATGVETISRGIAGKVGQCPLERGGWARQGLGLERWVET